MTDANFPACLAVTLKFEGGWSNDPHDPGGATFCGVTQATYDVWRRMKGARPQTVHAAPASEIAEIYRSEFWASARCDLLFPGLDLCQFDECVNSGAVEANRLLQRALGVSADGVFGMETLGALQKVTTYEARAALIRDVCAARLTFFHRLKTWVYFGTGWNARDVEACRKALAMLAQTQGAKA